MNGIMNYKGYIGSVEFSEADKVLYGKVQGVKSLISYEGVSVDDLIKDFHSAVDDYLDMCEAEGTAPEMSYKGTFNVRVKPEIHKEAAIYAMSHGYTLNRFVEESMVAMLRENCTE